MRFEIILTILKRRIGVWISLYLFFLKSLVLLKNLCMEKSFSVLTSSPRQNAFYIVCTQKPPKRHKISCCFFIIAWMKRMCLFLMKNIQKSSAHNTSKVKSPPLNFWHGYLLLQFSGGCGEPMRFCVLLPFPLFFKVKSGVFFRLKFPVNTKTGTLWSWKSKCWGKKSSPFVCRI